MTTIYKFQDTEAAIDSIADADRFLMFDSSAGGPKYALGTDISSYIRGGQGSPSVVNSTSTQLVLTAALHAGKTVTMSASASSKITLPQATGTGNRYHIVYTVAATATTSSIAVANATDVIQGVAWMLTTAADAVIGFKTSASSDTIVADGTTLGGVVYDNYMITDVKTGFFIVNAYLRPTGTYATPFVANV